MNAKMTASLLLDATLQEAWPFDLLTFSLSIVWSVQNYINYGE